MTTQQPEALRLANILRGIDARSLFANEKLSAASAALENQHARITELESQLAQRFDAADMATAAAQGFRDGVAPVSAVSAPVAWKHDCAALLANDVELWIDACPHCGKPRMHATQAAHPSPPGGMGAAKEQQAGAFQAALDIRTAQGWKLGGDKAPVLYTDEINGQQVCRDDVWLCTTDAFTHPYPKEGTAWWISVDERLPGEQGHDSEQVLVFINGHCKLTDMECRQGGAWGLRLGYFDADRQVFRVHGRPEPHVTHWRQEPPAPPIPAAPNPADGESK